MAKLDIYKLDWIDVVFSGRNKEYGAYELRRNNSRTRSKALLIGSIVFILAVSSPMIIKLISGFMPEKQEVVTEVELMDPPPLDEKKLPPPPPPEPEKPPVTQTKFPPPVVVPPKEAEEPPTVEILKVTDPGQKNIEGDPNADIKIDVPVGNAKEEKVVEDTGPISMEIVQVKPSYPGGPEAWAKFMQGYNYPPLAAENNISGTVYVSFVVEKDGKLTNIKTIGNPLGFGTAEEAIRLLKTSKPWNPGIQNSRPVRVQFTQPIVLKF